MRLRDFANAFTPDNISSICDADHSPALEAIAHYLRQQSLPACYTRCVEDTDPSTEIVVPECIVYEEFGASRVLTDPGGLTAPDADDMSAECLAHGYNLEFKLVRRFPALSGTTVSASCTLAGSPELSCPGIGG